MARRRPAPPQSFSLELDKLQPIKSTKAPHAAPAALEPTFRAPTRQHKLPRLLEEIKAPAPLREAKEQGGELREGLLSPVYAGFGATQLWVSDVGQLIADSSKMQV
jgi:hypothetical protein